MSIYHLLEIEFEYNGLKQVITPILLQDECDIILIDCGYPDFIPLTHWIWMEPFTRCSGCSSTTLNRLFAIMEVYFRAMYSKSFNNSFINTSLKLNKNPTWETLFDHIEIKEASHGFI